MEEQFTYWCLVIGLLLISLALSSSVLKRLPLSLSMIYLSIGILIGPLGLHLLVFDPFTKSEILGKFCESVLVISLFTAGLKLRAPLSDKMWWIAVRLASISMLVTVACITAIAYFLFKIPLGFALLLASVLAPTDPVLASDVQVSDPKDRDRLRFSLTGEAGLNDGSAFPMVALSLGILGMHQLGDYGSRWVAVDVIGKGIGGIIIGGVLGSAVAHLILYLRRQHREAVGLDDFLALGLMILTFGVSLFFFANAFIAAIAAGIAFRRVERMSGNGDPAVSRDAKPEEEVAIHPDTAPAHMAQSVLVFTEQLERICEVIILLVVGSLLRSEIFTWKTILFLTLLFAIVRPFSVYVGLWRSEKIGIIQKRLIAWFGIRGIGSLYYIFYVIHLGIDRRNAMTLLNITLATIAVSAVIHGISVTPLMNFYTSRITRLKKKSI